MKLVIARSLPVGLGSRRSVQVERGHDWNNNHMHRYSRLGGLSCWALTMIVAGGMASAGVVTITQPEPGRLVITGNDMRLVYDAHGSPQRNATLISESRIHGASLMDAHAVWGGPHLRWVGYLEGHDVHSQLPWQANIVQSGQLAAGFTTEVDSTRGRRTAHFYDAAVTHVFFYDLPEVILFDVELIRRRAGAGGEFDGIAMCAYASDRYLYNGMRLWNDDAPFEISYGSGPAETMSAADTVNGIFLKYRGKCRYVRPHLTRNLVLAQRDGANGPDNPACGWIFRGRFDSAVTCDFGGYYAHMLVVRPRQPTPNPGDRANVQVLWFQGGRGNLDSLEKIFALEQAFREPMQIERVEQPGRIAIYARDTTGRPRPWEIVVLGAEWRAIVTAWPVFRGPSAVMLLRNIRPRQRVLVGYLPLPRAP